MKLGIMQPYFFPYAQQFRHINQCDEWILFDTVKFSRKTWTTRNRVGNLHNEFSYVSVPVEKGATRGDISDAPITQSNWRAVFFSTLRVYDGLAPFYNETVTILQNCLSPNLTNLGKLNGEIILHLCRELDIQTNIRYLSEMKLHLPTEAAPGEWALIISKQVGAQIYSNAPGGRHLFDVELYKRNAVEIEFYEPSPLIYKTRKLSFVPDLSIIDTLMWIGLEGVRNFVHN